MVSEKFPLLDNILWNVRNRTGCCCFRMFPLVTQEDFCHMSVNHFLSVWPSCFYFITCSKCLLSSGSWTRCEQRWILWPPIVAVQLTESWISLSPLGLWRWMMWKIVMQHFLCCLVDWHLKKIIFTSDAKINACSILIPIMEVLMHGGYWALPYEAEKLVIWALPADLYTD